MSVISIYENLVKRTADLLVSEGYLSAGYEYLGIDDCWLEKKRGPDGRMVPDRERFPNGMKAIADYIHNKGLKFGMYQDYGNYTCAGYPGVLGNEALDIQTLVDWEIDYLKLDGCYIDPKDMDEGYPAFGKMLNQTGRPILYSCSWPAYQEPKGIHPDYVSLSKHCNMWRNWDDIDDSWSSLKGIMDWFGDNQDRFAHHAGPGHWNDPDMGYCLPNIPKPIDRQLRAISRPNSGSGGSMSRPGSTTLHQYIFINHPEILLNQDIIAVNQGPYCLLIGNFGLSVDQARVQMAVWAVLAAPLLISTDLATIRPEFKEILLNQDIIAVNQDPLGKQGVRVWKEKVAKKRRGLEIWNRELSDGSYAVAFVSQRDDGIPYAANFTQDEMKLPKQAYIVKDLYRDEPVRSWGPEGEFYVRINPSGVKFYKFTPNKTAQEPMVVQLANNCNDNVMN